jgi:hypothetical protein
MFSILGFVQGLIWVRNSICSCLGRSPGKILCLNFERKRKTLTGLSSKTTVCCSWMQKNKFSVVRFIFNHTSRLLMMDIRKDSLPNSSTKLSARNSSSLTTIQGSNPNTTTKRRRRSEIKMDRISGFVHGVANGRVWKSCKEWLAKIPGQGTV